MAVDINGDGLIGLGGTSTTQGRLRLAEDTDNGTNYVELTANASVTSNRTVTFPDADINFVNGLGVAQGGTGSTTLTAENVIIGNGTSAVKFVAAGTSGNVLTSNGTAWVSQAAGASGGDYIMNVYTTPGTWTKPAGLKAIKVTVVGGGGGSRGGFSCDATSGRSGSGGGASIEYIDAPAIPGPQPYTVGAGGTGGATSPPASNGGAGGTSSFGGPTAFLSATGGAGGNTPQPQNPGIWVGGVGSNGQINIAGGATLAPTGTPGIEFVSGGSIFGGGTGGSQYLPFPGAPRGYGVGGSGANGPHPSLTPSPTTGVGQPGATGVVIVEEFY